MARQKVLGPLPERRPQEEINRINFDLLVTLRDQFAMAALTGIWSGKAEISLKITAQRDAVASARIAYEIADAMIEARKTPGASTAPETP